jgi:hypothetical protein
MRERGDLARLVRTLRQLTAGALSIAEIRARLERGEPILTWEEDDRDTSAELHARIRRELGMLGACGYELELVMRADASSAWERVESFEPFFAREDEDDSLVREWPSWMASAPSFPLDSIRLETASAARAAWETLKREGPGESFYAFGLYPSEDDLAIQSAASSEEGLLRVAARHDGDVAEPAIAMRWWDADWPYACVVNAPFDRVNARLAEVRRAIDEYLGEVSGDVRAHRQRYRRDVAPVVRSVRAEYVEGLAALDREGLFGRGAERERIVIGIFGPDEPGMIRSIEQLNPPSVVARWRDEVARGEAVARVG